MWPSEVHMKAGVPCRLSRVTEKRISLDHGWASLHCSVFLHPPRYALDMVWVAPPKLHVLQAWFLVSLHWQTFAGSRWGLVWGATLEGTEFLRDPSKFPWNRDKTTPSYLTCLIMCIAIMAASSSLSLHQRPNRSGHYVVFLFFFYNNGVQWSFLYSYFVENQIKTTK